MILARFAAGLAETAPFGKPVWSPFRQMTLPNMRVFGNPNSPECMQIGDEFFLLFASCTTTRRIGDVRIIQDDQNHRDKAGLPDHPKFNSIFVTVPFQGRRHCVSP